MKQVKQLERFGMSKEKWWRKPILILAFGLISLFVQGQNSYPVEGELFDEETHQGVADAQVFLAGKSTLTDENGSFRFDSIPAGTHLLHYSHIAYVSSPVNVRVNKPQHLHLDLKPVKISIAPVVIENDFLLSGPKESSLSMEVADRDFLEKNFGNTLANSLEKIPGVNTLNTGVGIAKPVIRGMTFNRVIVNDQGIKQEGQQWGADHGLEVDQYNVQRVEIVKGPTALQYGSDGLGGVVNLKPAPIPKMGSLGAEVLGVYRSNNQLFGTSVGLSGNQKNVFFRARATWQGFGDYQVPADSFTYNTYRLAILDQHLKNTAGRELNFSGELGTAQDWGVLRLSVSNFNQHAGLFPGAIGVPRSYQLFDDGDRRNIDLPRQEINHFKVIANAKLFFGDDLLQIDGGVQDNSRQELSFPHVHGLGPAPVGNLAHGLHLQTATFNARYHHQHNPHFKTVYGFMGQAQQNDRSGFEFLIPTHQNQQAGLFATAEYEVGTHLTLNGGLRYDLGWVKTKGYLSPVYADPVTIVDYVERAVPVNRNFGAWSGALGMSWYPSSKWNLKVNLGRAFRMPTPTELAENGVHHGTFRHERGDMNLNPETGWQFDLGVACKSDVLVIKASPFFNYFDNYIFLRPSVEFSPLPDAGQIYQYTEARAIHTGAEMLVEVHPFEPLHLSAGADYVWNINLDTYLPLPFTPPFSLSSEVDYDLPVKNNWLEKWEIGLESTLRAAQNRVDRNEPATPGYHLLNLSSSADFNFSGQPVTLHFRVNNLLNKAYLNHLSRYRILNLPEQGRNFMVTLKVPITLRKADFE